MTYLELPWSQPRPASGLDRGDIPNRPGVYVFSETVASPTPNPQIPPDSDPGRASAIQALRSRPCVLYVGQSKNLRSRLPGYRFRPYLTIKRRPAGSPPKHVADRHRGRALLHAQQYFAEEGLEPQMFVRWAVVTDPLTTESALIKELRPLLNTTGVTRD